ncbi:Protein of uncharacterised function (DUF2644) [Actinobacillus equuli]|nr:Protein of uncharacterised function (DUF2644) [Actinobacillus equuli]
MLKELLSTNGTLSTTSTVQLIGTLCVFGLTIYAVVTGQSYAESLLNNVLIYLFGATTAKGVVTTVQAKFKGVSNGQITSVSESRETA